MSRKILSEKPISLERIKDLLKFRGEQAELNYIQRVTLEYAHKYSKHFPNSEEMLDSLNQKFEISREKGLAQPAVRTVSGPAEALVDATRCARQISAKALRE